MDKFYWIGAALISSQRVEFLTHGIISHFKNITSEKQFKDLTPRIFLDDTEENRKLRRQTLGQVLRIFKQEEVISINDKLDIYLKKRNLLVHDFWRNYLKTASDSNNSEIIIFCKEFIKDSGKIENFYKGLLYGMAKRIAKINGVEIPSEIIKLESQYSYFINCLKNKNLT